MSVFEKLLGVVVMASAIVACAEKPDSANVKNLIPDPVGVQIEKGSLRLGSTVGVSIVDSTLLPAIHYLDETLPVDVRLSAWEVADIIIVFDDDLQVGGYHLDIDSDRINISAADYNGVTSAIATLRQLLPATLRKDQLVFPLVQIEDAPRFGWRGVHLDVSRHFYDKEEVKSLLDKMALYKFNKFHWHLTDDQGWRIEIKQYPYLTEKGAWREFNWQDKECLRREKEEHNVDYGLPAAKLKTIDGKSLYGGYYTQDDIREVVAYAAERGIDIIPEIDMPGHFLAAIEEYPFVTCKNQKGWGTVFSSPVCPGNDDALEFCKNIWREVFQLFPYEYVHVGGDEVDKANWKRCQDCRTRARKEGLASTDELQAWFLRDMEVFFKENGRKMMGWDEVLEDGLSQNTVISWWRSWVPDAVQRATAQGMQVVVCPNSYLYFDVQQDQDYISRIYEWEPMPEKMTSRQEQLVRGIQCNIWTEWIPTAERMEYMVFPRLLAASEVAWRNANRQKDYPAFEKKVIHHIARMDDMGVNYRIPELTGFCEKSVFVDKDELEIHCALEDVEIHYTTDGAVPTLESPRYVRPIEIEDDVQFALRAFRPDGSGDQIFKVSFSKEEYLPAVSTNEMLISGLEGKWYDYQGCSCSEIEQATFNKTVQARKVEIPEGVGGNVGLVLEGYIDIPETGIYTFSLLSDDGSVLCIDGQEVVGNDGLHGPKARLGQKALQVGLHRIKILYFDCNGGVLRLNLVDEEGHQRECPEKWFKHLAK